MCFNLYYFRQKLLWRFFLGNLKIPENQKEITGEGSDFQDTQLRYRHSTQLKLLPSLLHPQEYFFYNTSIYLIQTIDALIGGDLWIDGTTWWCYKSVATLCENN